MVKEFQTLGSYTYAKKGGQQGDLRKKRIEEDKRGICLLGRCCILGEAEEPIPRFANDKSWKYM